jgi:Trk-type K+ transport system membrane component
MWIGASPASTGGGIKTTTFAVALLNLRSIVTGRRHVEVFGKQIPAHVTTKAFSTVLLSLLYMVTALFALLMTEQHPFELLLFEVVSAMSTVGLSAGITAQLTTEGKYIIIATMIVGRIGFLAFILALIPKRQQPEYEHITEEVLIT